MCNGNDIGNLVLLRNLQYDSVFTGEPYISTNEIHLHFLFLCSTWWWPCRPTHVDENNRINFCFIWIYCNSYLCVVALLMNVFLAGFWISDTTASTFLLFPSSLSFEKKAKLDNTMQWRLWQQQLVRICTNEDKHRNGSWIQYIL